MHKVFINDEQKLGASRIIWPSLFRQTFNGQGVAKNCVFTNDLSTNDHDWFVCQYGPVAKMQFESVPRSRRILILVENPNIMAVDRHYIENFGVVVDPFCLPNLEGQSLRTIRYHPGTGWWYGVKMRTDAGLSHHPITENFLVFNDLVELVERPNKTKLVSMICSGKQWTQGHKWRTMVAHALKRELGDDLDVFGFGWNPINDKRAAIDPYQFHIVIEADEYPYWMTEKLTDAILGYATPIYAGATRVQDFFSDHIHRIDFSSSPEFVAKKIRSMVESGTGIIDQENNRKKVLFEHNFFYLIASIVNNEM